MVVMSGLCRNSEYFSKVSCLVDPLSLLTFEDMFFLLTMGGKLDLGHKERT